MKKTPRNGVNMEYFLLSVRSELYEQHYSQQATETEIFIPILLRTSEVSHPKVVMPDI